MNTKTFNRLFVNQKITEIAYQEEWKSMQVIIYPSGLGKVRDLISLLPTIKELNIKFFLDSGVKENYEAVQILSSLGIYSGLVINEHADWERLTDLMYYALCGRVAHAPIEPFQYVYDNYARNRLVDYGVVYGDDFFLTTKGTKGFHKGTQRGLTAKGAEEAQRAQRKSWQQFFYEPTECAACVAWRICMGKYSDLKDKTGCQTFSNELLMIIEHLKF